MPSFLSSTKGAKAKKAGKGPAHAQQKPFAAPKPKTSLFGSGKPASAKSKDKIPSGRHIGQVSKEAREKSDRVVTSKNLPKAPGITAEEKKNHKKLFDARQRAEGGSNGGSNLPATIGDTARTTQLLGFGAANIKDPSNGSAFAGPQIVYTAAKYRADNTRLQGWRQVAAKEGSFKPDVPSYFDAITDPRDTNGNMPKELSQEQLARMKASAGKQNRIPQPTVRPSDRRPGAHVGGPKGHTGQGKDKRMHVK